MFGYVSRLVNNTFFWLVDMGEKELVNEEEVEEDEGYNSFESLRVPNVRKRDRRELDEHSLSSQGTLEEVKEKFRILKEVYSELKDEHTRVQFEVETLKDDREEREQDLGLFRKEINALQEENKVMIYHRKEDRSIINQQTQFIEQLKQQQQ